MMGRRLRLGRAVCASTVSLAAACGVLLHAQIANNPYKVNYNWDKLEGRKIGVASGIRPDPDGKHLWILDRCGANGCGIAARPNHPGRHGRKVREELREG